MSHHLFQAQQRSGHEQKKWYERNVLSLLVSAATQELIILSIKQKNDIWTEEDKIPPGKYTLKKNEKELKRKKQTPTTSLQLSQLPQNTTFFRNKQGLFAKQRDKGTYQNPPSLPSTI
jgi:hypothetical protein